MSTNPLCLSCHQGGSEKPLTSMTSELPKENNQTDTMLYVQFLVYTNPNNLKISGVPCDQDGSPCDVLLELCVSTLTSK